MATGEKSAGGQLRDAEEGKLWWSGRKGAFIIVLARITDGGSSSRQSSAMHSVSFISSSVNVTIIRALCPSTNKLGLMGISLFLFIRTCFLFLMYGQCLFYSDLCFWTVTQSSADLIRWPHSQHKTPESLAMQKIIASV